MPSAGFRPIRFKKRSDTSHRLEQNVVKIDVETDEALVSAAAYFNDISDGWGDHFLDAIEIDLADLRSEAGIHAIQYGLPCKFAKVFPFAIYYRVESESAIV
jgi:hypothetical protein